MVPQVPFQTRFEQRLRDVKPVAVQIQRGLHRIVRPAGGGGAEWQPSRQLSERTLSASSAEVCDETRSWPSTNNRNIGNAYAIEVSGSDEIYVWVASDDVEYDIEIGLAGASFQFGELAVDPRYVIPVRSLQLGLQECARCGKTEMGAGTIDILPDEYNGLASTNRTAPATQHVIERIEAFAQFPVLMCHEDAVDLCVKRRGVVNSTPDDRQDGGRRHCSIPHRRCSEGRSRLMSKRRLP